MRHKLISLPGDWSATLVGIDFCYRALTKSNFLKELNGTYASLANLQSINCPSTRVEFIWLRDSVSVGERCGSSQDRTRSPLILVAQPVHSEHGLFLSYTHGDLLGALGVIQTMVLLLACANKIVVHL
jgi:hypothetical protein